MHNNNLHLSIQPGKETKNQEENMNTEHARKCTYPRVAENMYLVTDTGRIYSCSQERYLHPTIGTDGYDYVGLKSIHNGKRIQVAVHRLVAWEFVPNPNNYPVVDHLDAKKLNNKAYNLEWVTYKENTNRAARMGLLNGRVYTKETVIQICDLLEEGYSVIDVFRELTPEGFEVRDDEGFYQFIKRVRKRDIWEEVSKDYTFTLESTSKLKGNKFIPKPEKSDYGKDVIVRICELLQDGLTPIQVFRTLCPGKERTDDANLYHLISDIRERVRWTNVSKDYVWKVNSTKVPYEQSDIYMKFCEGYTTKEVMHMYGIHHKKENEKLYNRIIKIKTRYKKLNQIPNKQDIDVIS